jgi:hypothetical protein
MISFGFGGEFGDAGWMVRSMAIGSWERAGEIQGFAGSGYRVGLFSFYF